MKLHLIPSLILSALALTLMAPASSAQAVSAERVVQRAAAISLTGNGSGYAGNAINLTASPGTVNPRAAVYLQYRTPTGWKSAAPMCTFNKAGKTAKWVVVLPKASSITYRVVAKYNGRTFGSNLKTVTIKTPPSLPDTPTAPITEAKRVEAVTAMVDSVNKYRIVQGLDPLTLNWAASTNAQVIAKTYYTDGVPPNFSAAKVGFQGTTQSMVGPNVANPFLLRADLTTITAGFYYDQNKAFNGDMAAFVVMAN